jgi:6-phosphofructokinase 1
VEEAQRAINAAHVEAESIQNGVGLVKLMGRYSGYIAMHATLASRDVDLCLIPEVPFYMDGPGGLLEFAKQRLRENGHMVIVVAEGAGQELMAESMGSLDKLSDASGNRLLLDVGLWLCQHLKDHFVKEFKEPLNLKYIDPTYMIRAIPSNASDNVYCTLLAHSAIHGAMAGYCGFTVGPVNNRHCYIPISRVTATQRQVNIADRMWARLLSPTNQPDFLQYKKAMQELRKQNALKQAEKIESDVAAHNSNSAPTSSSSPSAGNGNGSSKSAHKETPKIETGDRQYTPVEKEEMLLTTPVPGDPTKTHNHTAP